MIRTWVAQLGAVVAVNLRSLPQRAGSALVAVVGIAGVVVVFVAVLSIGEGFRRTLLASGSPDTAIVLRAGSDTEMTSGLTAEQTRIVKEAPGVRRTAGGPIASAELFVIVNHPRKTTRTDANVPLRGVQPAAFQVRDEVRIVEGRMFRWGTNEIIVGRAAAREFVDLEVGRTHRWGDSPWTVVGVFDAGGGVAESEIWADAGVVQPAYRRGSSFQSVYARLESPLAFDRFKEALAADPRLNVTVLRETDYYAEQSVLVHRLIRTLGLLVAALMGIGAIFGAVNTMYAAVAARTREIATLRALGFGALPVVASVLVESMLLAFAGGLAGGALAYAAFNGYQTATINWQTFSQVAFGFAVTPALVGQGLAYALAMGLVGGLWPAIRAARLPVAAALREP
jgi:putative ABC transport system permease protein